jgi:SAM-dependent methyltransferase
MRLCLQCQGTQIDKNWRCEACTFSPTQMYGFPCFAPELAAENDGMDAASHDHLDALQDSSFWFRARNRLIEDLCRRHFPGARRILELGCGTGYVTQALRKALPDGNFTASEIYANGLGHAQRRLGSGVELLQMDAREIPFREEFDLVCAFDVLEHIDEDTRVIDRIAEALKPGGGIMLSVPQHRFLWSQVDDYSHHKRRYLTRELTGKCVAAGFTVIRDTSFVCSLLPLMFIHRMTDRKASNIDPRSEHTLPRFLDRTFEMALDLERRLIRTNVSLPFGGSRFVLARCAGPHI